MISSLIKIPKIDFVGSWKSTELLFHRGNSSPKEPFHLDVQGFEFHKCSTSMAYADFFQEDWMWIEDGKPVKLFGMLTFCNLKSCKDAGFYCFFFFVELQENILQRYHAEIVDLIKKTTGETEHRNSVFCLPFFFVWQNGGLQVPNMWFPLTTTSDPQLANPVRRRSRCAFYKTVSCWTGVTNNCSNTCRVEPKFNLLEAKSVFLFDIWCEVPIFFDFLFRTVAGLVHNDYTITGGLF